MSTVTIHYTRIPDRLTRFTQRYVTREADCTITLMERTPLRAPVMAGDRAILQDGAPVVWFTWDGAWHDVGAFHHPDGRLSGWYANIITPVRFISPFEWETTDLFLDVWFGADGDVRLLDEDEFDAAVDAGLLDDALAARARGEAHRLLDLARAGEWPDRLVRAWTLGHARSAVDGASSAEGGTPPPGAV